MTATTTYAFEALSPDGSVRKGKIQSESRDAAASALSGQSLVPLSLEATGTGLKRDLAPPQRPRPHARPPPAAAARPHDGEGPRRPGPPVRLDDFRRPHAAARPLDPLRT